MPTSTSAMMASILACQFAKLQAPLFQQVPQDGAPSTTRLTTVSTPLISTAWRQVLSAHPDWDGLPAPAEMVASGIEQGFRIGLRGTPPPRPVCKNSPTAQGNAQVIDGFIHDQLEKGYMAGAYEPQQCRAVVTNSIAAVPKKTPGKWRVVVDLSRPSGSNMNDHLRREATHVAYSSVEDAAHLMHFFGTNCIMAKLDIKEAYRMVPIHPDDLRFLGVCWRGQIFIDCQLTFGLASAPAIFSALGEALEWILRQRGVKAVIHYLDDFLVHLVHRTLANASNTSPLPSRPAKSLGSQSRPRRQRDRLTHSHS